MVLAGLRRVAGAAAIGITGWLGAAAAGAGCAGTDLLPGLPADLRAQIEARAAAAPFPEGNLWRARRGTARIVLAGTYHLDDPRHEPMMARLAPLIADAALVLVEALPEEAERLAAAMAETPELGYLVDGPTLRDLLSDADWQRYAEEMAARGVPAFMASRLQPWLAFTMLSLPVCAIEAATGPGLGLDDRIVAQARALDIPVAGLEGMEVLFDVFDTLTQDDALDILRVSILVAGQAEDMLATLTRAYFDGQHRLVWEFSRGWMPEPAREIFSQDRADAMYDRLEASLLQARNRAWLAQILPLAEQGPLFVAVGAAHLSGEDGVLVLLDRAGFVLEPLEM